MKHLRTSLTWALVVIFAHQVPAVGQSSVYPLGGQRGTDFEVVIPQIGSADAVWLDSDQLSATVEREPDGKGMNQTRMRVRCSPDAQLGYHLFRLTQFNGGTRPLPLLIHDEPSIVEAETPHQKPQEAQRISWPCALYGRIGAKGELDYFSFEVSAGDELLFELNTASGLIPPNVGHRLFNTPELSLLAPTGSWFDPHRAVRLMPEDHSTFFYWPPRLPSQSVINLLPRYTHRFEEAGRYLIEIGHQGGLGGIHHCYQLRIVKVENGKRPAWTERKLLLNWPSQWQEREYSGHFEVDWLQKIFARSGLPVPTPDAAPTSNSQLFQSDLAFVQEQEPNDLAAEALELSIPVAINGSIHAPGDVDFFRIEIEAGAQLCFELRTSDFPPPHFSPRLDVLDAEGTAVLSNIFTKIAGDGDDWIKSLEPKTIYTFDEGGQYHLRLRDLTDARGGRRYQYQLLVRPQLPHVGEVYLATISHYRGLRYYQDAINIKAGTTKKLLAVVEEEEGFDGTFALSIEDLPPGVDLLPSNEDPPDVSFTGQVYEARGTIHKFRYRPPRKAFPLMLRAAADAPHTKGLPVFSTLTLWPQQEGNLLAPISGYQVPVMVIP
jgi:hypothetical protein